MRFIMARTRKTFAHVAALPYLSSASAVHATGTMPSGASVVAFGRVAPNGPGQVMALYARKGL